MGLVASLSLNSCQNSFITVFLFYGLSFRPLRSKHILGDPGAATFLVLKHFPNVDLGITSGLSTSKYVWLNIGEGEGTLQAITVRTKVSGVKISRIFRKIQEKRFLFQRFVTSIVVGTIQQQQQQQVYSVLPFCTGVTD